MANVQEATETPRKPLVFETNPFDDERLDDVEYASAYYDASYVPGYSEKKAENERRAMEGKPLIPLPRLQWVRIARKGGRMVTSADEGMIEWQKLGYRACGLDDLESHSFGMPPTASVGPDGLIRRGGDLALFIVGAERADRNRIRQKRINEEFSSRDPDLSGKTGSVYENVEKRVRQKGTLKEIAETEIPSPLE